MNEDQNIITWIIPVYNGEKYILKTIESIAKQPCESWNIIVIDDGSEDNTLKVVSEIKDDRIRVIHKSNGGTSRARNLGLDHVHSQYVAFIDADDVICRNAFDKDIYKILQTGEYDILSFSYFNGDQKLKRGSRVSVQNGHGKCNEREVALFKHISSFIYKSSIFNGEKKLRFLEDCKIREDISLQFLAYKEAENICFIDKNWSVYRNNINSTLHRLKNGDFLIDYAVPAWHWAKTRCDTKEDQDYCDILIFAEFVDYIRISCKAGEPIEKIQKAAELLPVKEALKNYPILWGNRKEIYEEFSGNPEAYWKKQRKKGLVENIVRRITHIPVFRSMYFRLIYKENLRSIL